MKEYRVMQLITEGPHAGKWGRAHLPGVGPMVHPFDSLKEAQDWIAERPEWYAKFNRRWPPELRKEIPTYRIEAREVGPWEVAE